MADHSPETAETPAGLIRGIIGTLAFAAGFEGVVMTMHGDFAIGAAGIVGCVALSSLAYKWPNIHDRLARRGVTIATNTAATIWVAMVLLLIIALAYSPLLTRTAVVAPLPAVVPTAAPLAPVSLDSTILTAQRRETFRQAAFSADNLGVSRVRVIAVISEPETTKFASDLVGLFIESGFQPYDFGRGDYVGAPKTHRLASGITIIAPAPSIGAEAVRVAFERIGIQTRRVADRDRTDDYLIVEVGPVR